MDKRLLEQISSARHKFNACRLQQNEFNLMGARQDANDYIFQQIKAKGGTETTLDKENIEPYQTASNQNKQVNDGVELRQRHANKGITCETNEAQVQIESEEEDLTDLWNQAQKQQQCDEPDKKIDKAKVAKQSDSDSSCEMTQQQLESMVSGSNLDNCPSLQQKQYAHNCISQIQEEVMDEDSEDDGQWARIAHEMQMLNKNQTKEQHQQRELASLATINDINNDQAQDFVIIDTPSEFLKAEALASPNQQPQQLKTENYLIEDKKLLKHGPWVYNTEVYQIHEKLNMPLIHKIPRGNREEINNEVNEYESSRSIRIINWEISEEKKPQIRALRSKRNCHRMFLLEHGKDFLIFDHYKFILSALRESTHLYLGMRAYCNNFSTDAYKIGKSDEHNEKERINVPLVEYLYLPSTGESLLQSKYCSSIGESQIKKFSIHLSLTGEIVASCDRYVYDQEKDKREVLEVKLYDSFEQKQAEYLGIIESKISSFSQQWYCDSVVYIPRKKTYSNKLKDKSWQKFKIQLKLSELGTIVAELGIFDASSSVTNCILFGESKSSQFMMGTILESSEEINYILRVAGLSPLMAFAVAISRKIFVLAS